MAEKNPIKLTTEFTVTKNMIESFARLSGDYNSMHMDAEVARKSRFRQPIVHGMLPFSFLSIIHNKFPQQKIVFNELSGHFNKPVHVDDVIDLEIKVTHKKDNLYGFQGKWTKKDNNELLLLAKGKLSTLDKRTNDSGDIHEGGRNSFLLEATTENQYTINDLKDQHEELAFGISSGLTEQYTKDVLSAINDLQSDDTLRPCPHLMATLLLSTMVGMRIPGRYATFTRFNICYSKSLALQTKYTLHAKLDNVSVEAEHLNASCEIRDGDEVYASGNYEVVVNSPPMVMLSCAQIKETALGFGLTDKVALVTGASRGIGETTAKLLALHGVKAAVCYFRGRSDAEAIVKDIADAGGEAYAVQCDLTDDKQVTSMIQLVTERYGGVDILVNNAVREFTPRDILDLEWNDYLDELEVSVKGMHACCKALIPIFKKSGHGKIINLSTIAVANPVSGQSRYITAKSAVEGYTKSLAVELAPYDIQVNLVIPNMTDTDLISVIPALFRDRIASERTTRRNVQPIEVAQSIVYLASNWSNAMTGQKIVLNLGEPPFA